MSTTAIIFANNESNVFVIDIPRSLELVNNGGRICSSKAPISPYETPEPKGKKREALISTFSRAHVNRHERIQAGVRYALQVAVSSRVLSAWCFPRTERDEFETPNLSLSNDGEVDRDELPLILSSTQNDLPSQHSISRNIVLNPNIVPTYIQTQGQGDFWIPTMCTFVWSRIEHTLSLLESYPNVSDLSFDVVLMDPPWPNRSVRNSHKYHTAEGQSLDPFDYAIALVERHRKLTGYVATWITNKDAILQKVMKAMQSLNLVLVEEWIWVKVTVHGEPITPLDGVWRKPYEILLIFHHRNPSGPLTRRYIFAVPDLHSRKPNLKEMFAKLLQSQSVLELFARNLTTGWWCIGDEVLKFQHNSAWSVWPGSTDQSIP